MSVAQNPDAATLLDIYRRVSLIFQNDERLRSAIRSGKIAATYYASRGQEIIPAAISVNLTKEDYICTIYRGIHDMLAKGAPVKEIWAEIGGRAWVSQIRGDKRVTVAYFGDGASNIGAFHEALNMAAVWKLPGVTADDNVLVLGEDVADPQEGGIAGVTKGLSTAVGEMRVKSTPISEQAIMGAAVGARSLGCDLLRKSC